jgi:hypothetical protein
MATEMPQSNSFGSTLSGVANVAQLFLGQTTNTSGSTTGTQTQTDSGSTSTTTIKNDVSPDAVNALVKSILEGTNGLAAVSAGQRNAGLYNSSTNQLLVNDLATRTAGEAAKLNTSQTTTQVKGPSTQTVATNQQQVGITNKQAPVNPGKAAALLGGLQLVGPITGKSPTQWLTAGAKAFTGQGDNTVDTATQDAITSAYNDPSRSLDLVGASAGTDGLAGQTITGIDNASQSIPNFVDFGSSAAADTAQEVSSFADSTDYGSFVDAASSGIDGTTIAESLGGLFTDSASSLAGDAASSFDSNVWEDFTFADGGVVNVAKMMEARKSASGYADGGQVSKKTTGTIFQQSDAKRSRDAGLTVDEQGVVLQQGFTPTTPQERMSVFSLIDTLPMLFKALIGDGAAAIQPQGAGTTPSGKPGYANGGIVESNKDRVYAQGGNGYNANTGLRPTGGVYGIDLTSDSNDAVVGKIIRDNTRATTQGAQVVSNPIRTPVAAGANSFGGISLGENSGSATGDVNGGTPGMEGQGSTLGSVTGLSGAGISAAASAVTNGMFGASVPGLGGLIGAKDNEAALRSMGITALGMVNPALGLLAAVVSSATKSSGLGASAAGPGQADPGKPGTPTSLDALMSMTDAFGTATDTSSNDGRGAESSAGQAGNSAGGTTGTGADGTTGSTSAGGDAVAANGGHIEGPGTGTSDSIDIKISDGEYVIPADVVEALGVPFFDKLKSRYHTPVATRKG